MSTSEPTSHPLSSLTPQQRLAAADKRDLATVGAGVLAILASLMPYYTISFEGFGGLGAEVNAWHGFFGWFGAVCALAGAGALAAHVYGVALPVPVGTTVLGLFALGLLCTVLALFVFPGGGCDDDGLGGAVCDAIDQGHAFGYWLALLSTGAGTALAAMRRSAA